MLSFNDLNWTKINDLKTNVDYQATVADFQDKLTDPLGISTETE